jgi:hypothetical protein
VPFDFGGAFAFIGYGVFVIALLLAASVFGYDWYLKQQAAEKRAELQQAQASIDTATVQSFIDLNNQLIEGKRILDSHLVFSDIFGVIETLSPVNVRLNSLLLSATDARSGLLSAEGTAASFNALAALSEALGDDGRIKDAVFSGIAVDRNTERVSFGLSATVDPSLLAFRADTFEPVEMSVEAQAEPTTETSTDDL